MYKIKVSRVIWIDKQLFLSRVWRYTLSTVWSIREFFAQNLKWDVRFSLTLFIVKRAIRRELKSNFVQSANWRINLNIYNSTEHCKIRIFYDSSICFWQRNTVIRHILFRFFSILSILSDKLSIYSSTTSTFLYQMSYS